MSMLFVDVRGSTNIAEKMRPAEYSRLINRFYRAATDVLINTDAFIDQFVGDEVVGLYFPLFTGPNHARAAILAAKELLNTMGYTSKQGPWIPIGVGVHTGIAYMGTISGSEGSVSDVAAMGDNVNIAARIASMAQAGEVLISNDACKASEMDLENCEVRELTMKGKSIPICVHAYRCEPN